MQPKDAVSHVQVVEALSELVQVSILTRTLLSVRTFENRQRWGVEGTLYIEQLGVGADRPLLDIGQVRGISRGIDDVVHHGNEWRRKPTSRRMRLAMAPIVVDFRVWDLGMCPTGCPTPEGMKAQGGRGWCGGSKCESGGKRYHATFSGAGRVCGKRR